MAAPLTGIRACVFDAYGTLFDHASAAAACRDVLGERFGPLASLWRDKQLQYTWLRAAQGRHADFWQVTGDALDFALETLGIRPAGLRERLMSLYLTLDVFPEVPAVLQRLKAADFRLAVLSNGSPDMLHAAVARAKIGAMFEAILSVEEVGVYKPSAGLPAGGCAAGSRPPGDLIPVSQRLGCLRGIRIRHAGGVVQSLRAAPRTASRTPGSRGHLARGAAGAPWRL